MNESGIKLHNPISRQNAASNVLKFMMKQVDPVEYKAAYQKIIKIKIEKEE